MRKTIAQLLTMHHHIVRDLLRDIDIPFARYETHWWKRGQRHFDSYRRRMSVIETELDCLISSYVDLPDGRCIRISNHTKKNGLGDSYIDIVYDWQTGEIQQKHYVKEVKKWLEKKAFGGK